jgi:aquaporin Z
MKLRIFGEVFGTALLIYFGTGTVLFGGPYADLMSISLGWGMALAILVYTFGPLSGAHFNPVVTLTMYLTKRMDGKTAGIYVLSQLIGGLLGQLMVVMTYRSLLANTGKSWSTEVAANHLNGTVFPNISVPVAFATEVLLTVVLITVVLVMNNPQTNVNAGQAGIIVGLTIFVLVIVGGNLTGASMNPVRSLWPAIFAGGETLNSLWLYLVAPFVGGVIGVLIEKTIFASPTRQLKV